MFLEYIDHTALITIIVLFLLSIATAIYSKVNKIEQSLFLPISTFILMVALLLDADNTAMKTNQGIYDFKAYHILECNNKLTTYRVSKKTNWKIDFKHKKFYNDIYSVDIQYCQRLK